MAPVKQHTKDVAVPFKYRMIKQTNRIYLNFLASLGRLKRLSRLELVTFRGRYQGQSVHLLHHPM